MLKNKKNIAWIAGLLLALSFVVVAPSVLAQSSGGFECGQGFHNQNGVCVPDTGSSGLASANNLTGIIVLVIRYLLFFAGSIAVVFIIIGGYRYVTSAGNEEVAAKGKTTLVNAIIGVVVVVLAYAIVTVIINTVMGGAV